MGGVAQQMHVQLLVEHLYRWCCAAITHRGGEIISWLEEQKQLSEFLVLLSRGCGICIKGFQPNLFKSSDLTYALDWPRGHYMLNEFQQR